MKNELNPAVFWVAIVVLVVGVAGFWIYHTRASAGPGEGNTEESRRMQQQYKEKGTLINTPPGLGGAGGAGGGMRPGMPGNMGTPPGMSTPPGVGGAPR